MTQFKCVCIACRKEMMNFMDDGVQPNNGLAFYTQGHYGSTVFDPIGDGSMIEVCICDECVTKAAKDGLVLHRELTQRTKFKCSAWDGRNPHEGYVTVENITDAAKTV